MYNFLPEVGVKVIAEIFSHHDPNKAILKFTKMEDGAVMVEIDDYAAIVDADALSEAVKKVTE